MIFLDNLITGGNYKEDHCFGKQNCVRDHSACHNLLPFSLTTAESPPEMSDLSSCLLLQFSPYICFQSLNNPQLKRWSSWCSYVYMIWLLQERHVCVLNTEQLLPVRSILICLKFNTEHECYCTFNSSMWWNVLSFNLKNYKIFTNKPCFVILSSLILLSVSEASTSTCAQTDILNFIWYI